MITIIDRLRMRRIRIAVTRSVVLASLCSAIITGTKSYAEDPSTQPAANFYTSFYPGRGSKIKSTWVQSINVTSPAYCSDIQGDVTVNFKAPGMSIAKANCWQQPTADQPDPAGHEADLAPDLKLDADGNGSFVFHADQFPSGPIIVRLYAKDTTDKQDYCELQLFNKGGVSWNEGAPKSDPLPAKGMKLAFGDDFTGPLSISKDDSETYWTHWSGGDSSSWAFGENSGPHNPFSQVGTYLRIHASKAADAKKGVTGSLTPVHPKSSKPGITVKAPCYLECRFLAQNFPGSWPAFWVTTQGGHACDELDVIEGYGTNSKTGGIWTSYHCDSHFWGSTPAWAKEKGPDGKSLYPIGHTVVPAALDVRAGWSTTFHTYGLLVTQTDTVFYFDDVEVKRHPSNEPSKVHPMSFIVNLAVGGGGWKADLSRYGNQSDMWVDYIRMYQGEIPATQPNQ